MLMMEIRQSPFWPIPDGPLSKDVKKVSHYMGCHKISGDKIILHSRRKEVYGSIIYQDLHSNIKVNVDRFRVDTIWNYFAEDWGGGY